MKRSRIAAFSFLFAALAALAGACSSNAGFGGAPPYQGGQPNATPVQGYTSPYPGESGGPTEAPDTPLTVDSASARFGYDAYAADPVKAPRLVEVSFALNNAQASPMPVSDLAIAADSAKPVHLTLSLQALPNQDTKETLVAIAPPKDYSKTKQLSLTFGDGKGTLLAQDSIDFPTASEPAMTPLDKKRPAGGVTIDDVAVAAIEAPSGGLHYDLTFSATNASASDASIAYFTVTTPKTDKIPSDVVKMAVAVKIPARSEMAPISFVVPYAGKSKTLLTGTYTITASDGKNNIIAQGTGPLL
jgi:hypothetical protein